MPVDLLLTVRDSYFTGKVISQEKLFHRKTDNAETDLHNIAILFHTRGRRTREVFPSTQATSPAEQK